MDAQRGQKGGGVVLWRTRSEIPARVAALVQWCLNNTITGRLSAVPLALSEDYLAPQLSRCLSARMY
jgi:hypothetical protein